MSRPIISLLVCAFVLLSLAGCHAQAPSLEPVSHEEARNLPTLRHQLDSQARYVEMMSRALDLHDQGNISEAHDLAARTAFLFPKESWAAWFAEQTRDGDPIPQGASITFINTSNHAASTVILRYGGVSIRVEDLRPGETTSAYADVLPQSSVRLWVVATFENGTATPQRKEISGRCYCSDFGSVPWVQVLEGHVIRFGFGEIPQALDLEQQHQ